MFKLWAQQRGQEKHLSGIYALCFLLLSLKIKNLTSKRIWIFAQGSVAASRLRQLPFFCGPSPKPVLRLFFPCPAACRPQIHLQIPAALFFAPPLAYCKPNLKFAHTPHASIRPVGPAGAGGLQNPQKIPPI